MPYFHDFVDYIILTLYVWCLLMNFEPICALLLFECRWSCDFHVFMDIFMFYFLLEGFSTCFQNYLSSLYSSIGSDFQTC